MITEFQYAAMHRRVFRDSLGFDGFNSDVVEIPNGDGKRDDGKIYAHIGIRYLHHAILGPAFRDAHAQAVGIAVELGIPPKYWPSMETSVLRILEYPPCIGSHKHTDFSLFTLNLYRNIQYVETEKVLNSHMMLNRFNAHSGEILEMIQPDLPAMPHEVIPHPSSHQFSAVYFALPPADVELPNGKICGEWVEERKARSRASK
jgi:hypothetical protein